MTRTDDKIIGVLLFLLSVLTVGCSNGGQTRGVCILLDTATASKSELKSCQLLINHTLGILKYNDWLAVADMSQADGGQKSMIIEMRFGIRPLTVNDQKRRVVKTVSDYLAAPDRSRKTHLSGSIIQAIDLLNRTGSRQKYLLIHSDLQENQNGEENPHPPMPMSGIRVAALDVTALHGEQLDPRRYLKRLTYWRKRVEDSGGKWHLVNDLEELDPIFANN